MSRAAKKKNALECADSQRLSVLLQGLSAATNILLKPADSQNAIEDALAILGEAAGMDHILVFENQTQAQALRIMWSNPNLELPVAESAFEELFRDPAFNHWQALLSNGGMIHVQAKHLPLEGQRSFQKCGARSILAAPVLIEGRFWGVMMFVDTHKDCELSGEERSILYSAAFTLGTVLERQQMEAALRESEGRFRTLAENLGEGVGIFDNELVCTFANRALVEILGYPFESLIGKRTADFIVPEHQGLFRRQTDLQRLVHRNQFEVDTVRPDGERRNLLVTVAPFVEEGTGRRLIFTTFNDITDRRHTEQALRDSEERFKAFMDNSPLLAFIKDGRGHYIYLNEPCEQLFQVTTAQVFGANDLDWFPEDIALKFRLNDQEVLNEGKKVDYEVNSHSIDGLGHAWWVHKFPLRGVDGETLLGGVALDITDHKRVEDQLLRTEERLTLWVGQLEQHNLEILVLSEMSNLLQTCTRLDQAYSVISDFAGRLFPHETGMLMILDKASAKLTMMAQWGSLAGDLTSFAAEECWALRRARPHFANVEPGRPLLRCDHFPASNPGGYMCLPILVEGQPMGNLRLWTDQPDKPFYQSQQNLASALTEQIGLALSNLNLRELLREQAIRDPLTALLNRRYLYEVLDREIKRSVRSGQSLGVVMIDLDHFKQVNDTYGHAAGDRMLCEVASLLNHTIRSSDIACRYGGEEFVLVLPEANLEDAGRRAEQIRQKINILQVNYEGRYLRPVTASIGVADLRPDRFSMEALLAAADNAMYLAKEKGRDCVVLSV